MANWLIKRRLASNATRLAGLRSDLAVANEQLRTLTDDAADEATRAVVADNTAVSREARRAGEQADAMRRHRDTVEAEIIEREQRQDDLLDELGTH